MRDGAIQGFIDAIPKEYDYRPSVFKSLQNATQLFTTQYIGRFLIELVQNGHDAHKRGNTTGEVAIYLCPDESNYGCLYVANKGEPFTESDVVSVCNIALSSKEPGEAIGNKGLGFRSVLSVSNNPEIYSKGRSGRQHRFDGFCFRFADRKDLDSLIPDKKQRALAETDLPPLLVPISIAYPHRAGTKKGKVLTTLAKQGFSSVVRLPLSRSISPSDLADSAQSDSNQDQVLSAIKDLRSGSAPLLAFLPRLSKLTVRVVGYRGLDFEVKRKVTASNTVTVGKDKFETAILSDTGTADSTTIFIATREVPGDVISDAIQESLSQGKMDARWGEAKWSQPGEVAIALSLDSNEITPRFYNYFPMGSETKPPLQGLIHAGFFTQADRKSMLESIPLNKLYLDEAVKLAATTIRLLQDENIKLPAMKDPVLTGQVIVDLLCWRDGEQSDSLDFPTLILQALTSLRLPPDSSNLFPIISQKADTNGTWASGKEIASWSLYEGNEEISLDKLVQEAGVKAIHPQLGSDRIKRLEAFLTLKQVGIRSNLEPDGRILADAIATLASLLKGFQRKGSKNHTRWCTFYRELGDVLARVPGCFWRDKKILLCQDGALRDSREIPVFFPPNDLSLDIPKDLKGFFGVMDSKLDWNGEAIKSTRDLLKQRLAVRDFDSRELIESVATTPRRNNDLRIAILSWVFEIWKITRDDTLLENVDIEVPAANRRWKKAEEVFFSRGWPKSTLGTLMHSLLSSCDEDSELSKLQGRQLATPSAKPFNRKNIEDWSNFLHALRVTKGIPVEERKSSEPIMGARLIIGNNPEDAICSILDLGYRTRGYLARQIAAAGQLGGINNHYSGNHYSLRWGVSYIPGQEDFSTMSDSAKETFAELLVNLLPSFGDAFNPDHRIRFYPPNLEINVKETDWPSPALAFLKEAPWIPMQSSGDSQREYFAAPNQVIIDGHTNRRFPNFLPVPIPSIRRILGEEKTLIALRNVCDSVVYLDDEQQIEQVQLMANLFEERHIPDHHKDRFEKEYWNTWSKVLSKTRSFHWRWLEEEKKTTLYRVDGSLQALPITADALINHGIYVRDTQHELKPQLLNSLGRCVWGDGLDTLDATSYLTDIFPDGMVNQVSDVEIAAFIDGNPVDEVTSKSLSELIPCITEIIARCLVVRTKSVLQEHLDLSKDIQIKSGDQITVSVQDEELALPQDAYGSLYLEADGRKMVLVEQLDLDNPEWDVLAKASKCIAQGIGNEEVSESITLAFETIQDQFNDPLQAVTDAVNWEEVDTKLKLTDADKGTLRTALRGDDEQTAEYLRVVATYHLGHVEISRIWEESQQVGIDVLNGQLVKAIESKIPFTTSLLDQLSHARGLRDVFELCCANSLKEFNAVLVQLNKEPLDFSSEHADSVKSYVQQEYDEVIRPIREAFLSEFRSFAPLVGYVNGRDAITELPPDPSWGLEFSELSDEHINGHISTALKNLDLPKGDPCTLPSLSEIQDPNRAMVRNTIDASTLVVKAWCAKNNKTLHSLWNDPDQDEVAVNNFKKRGILEFELLDEKSTIKWLAELGYWPDMMRHSTDLNAVGLPSEDSDDVRRHAEDLKKKKEREQKVTLINNGNLELESGHEDTEALRISFEKVIKKNLNLLPDPGSIKGIEKPKIGKKPNPGKSRSGKGGSNERPTPDKLRTIGLLGELFVYEWLKQKMPKRDHESMWVSTYGHRVTGKKGDDNLGYDFSYRTGRGKRKTFIEVKSHLKDPKEIELGESEVRKGLECANRPSEGDYQIAYVSSLELGYEDIEISLLPNPYSEDGKSRFKFVGTGQKFRFRLS